MSTYVLISSATVGSGGAAGIDFTSIPSTYTDLQILVSARSTSAVTGLGFYFQFNGSSSAIYTLNELYAYSGGVGPYKGTSLTDIFAGYIPGTSTTANTFNSSNIYIPNYTSSTNKPALIYTSWEHNGTTNWENDTIAGLWASTAAINRVYIYPSSGNLAQYTTAYLYGISNA